MRRRMKWRQCVMAGFRDILGHKQEIAHLERAIESGKVSHAYIFTGEKGTGKHRLASAFAETLQCEDTQNRPCGKCHSCRQAQSGNHPDIIYVSHEKPSSIGVEDIRSQLAGDIQIDQFRIEQLHQVCNPYCEIMVKSFKYLPAHIVSAHGSF